MNIHSLLSFIPDKPYLNLMYYHHFHKFPEWNQPHNFNEKLQWLKLYDRRPEYVTMVDKVKAKKYVADRIGEQYIIPTLKVYTSASEINIDKLPSQFVLKCNHDSHSVYVCKDKSKFDFKSALIGLDNGLKRSGFAYGREWPYKDVPRRILAEKYMDDNGHVPIDYKVYCFNGEPYKVMLCLDRDKDEDTKFYSFDRNWNLLRHNKRGKAAPEGFTLPKPLNLEKMFEFAAELSKGIPFLRVDFYEVGEQLYFGELTLYPDSGFDSAILPEIDKLYGEMIKLPNKKRR